MQQQYQINQPVHVQATEPQLQQSQPQLQQPQPQLQQPQPQLPELQHQQFQQSLSQLQIAQHQQILLEQSLQRSQYQLKEMTQLSQQKSPLHNSDLQILNQEQALQPHPSIEPPILSTSPEKLSIINAEHMQNSILEHKLNPELNNGISLADSTELPIPISHLLSGNQYPGLTHVPQDIAKSFAPIQPQNPPTESDILYNDYVNNPYNLTLQPVDSVPLSIHNAIGEHRDSTNCNTTTASNNITGNVSNVFANYFGSDSMNIPPGSEMLFGGP